MTLVTPPVWSDERLEADRHVAIEQFREERMGEPLDQYLEYYEFGRQAVATLLELTTDLHQLKENAVDILVDDALKEIVRFICSPPISPDDLKTVSGVESMAPTRVTDEPALANEIMDVIYPNFDRERFPWLSDDREAEDHERDIAIVSTASLYAFRRTETWRRHHFKNIQEKRLSDCLTDECGFRKARKRDIDNLFQAPEPGTFWGEAQVCGRKADLVVRLRDGRLMPIECKVTNSGTNSIKRILNDAAAKATVWKEKLGTVNAIPTAAISGVVKLRTLKDAQDGGLTIFWAHDLEPMVDFVDRAR